MEGNDERERRAGGGSGNWWIHTARVQGEALPEGLLNLLDTPQRKVNVLVILQICVDLMSIDKQKNKIKKQLVTAFNVYIPSYSLSYPILCVSNTHTHFKSIAPLSLPVSATSKGCPIYIVA